MGDYNPSGLQTFTALMQTDENWIFLSVIRLWIFISCIELWIRKSYLNTGHENRISSDNSKFEGLWLSAKRTGTDIYCLRRYLLVDTIHAAAGAGHNDQPGKPGAGSIPEKQCQRKSKPSSRPLRRSS